MLKLGLKKYYNLCPTATNIMMNKYNLPFIKLDHMAIRSLDKKYYESQKFHDNFGIKDYDKMCDLYEFPKYSTQAIWYKQKINLNLEIPRIFTSWHTQKYDNLSDNLVDKINKKHILNYNEYLDLHNYNQYIAWTHLFQHDINHVAIDVYDIEFVTEKLIKQGYIFNDEGGIYKVSKDKNLIQTSIMADLIKFDFNDKTEKIPYAFLEFVQRNNNRDGFEAENANKIFSSTKNMKNKN
jgi:hypothetical protein